MVATASLSGLARCTISDTLPPCEYTGGVNSNTEAGPGRELLALSTAHRIYAMALTETLIRYRRSRISRALLVLLGIDFPGRVQVGKDLKMVHRGLGTVVYPRTEIGDRVRIYHQVTIGRKDAHIPIERSAFERIEIGDDVVLFPGSKVLGGNGVTRVGNGTILAANAVLMTSTGENEIWGGVPAKKLGDRVPAEP